MALDKLTRRKALGLFGALPLGISAAVSHSSEAEFGAGASQEIVLLPGILNDFALRGERNIAAENDFGIANGRATVGINYADVASLSAYFAPPYASSDFALEVRLFGEKVGTQEYVWYPSEVQRRGLLYGIAVSTSTVLAAEGRGGLIEITFANTSSESAQFPVQLNLTGSLDYVTVWDFARPSTDKKPTTATAQQRRVTRLNDRGAIAIGADLPSQQWEDWSSHVLHTL